MKLYLDNCCYCRPFDDQSQTRIKLESAAVLSIVKRARTGKDLIVRSTALDYEMSKLSNHEKRQKVQVLYEIAVESIPFTDEISSRAESIISTTSIRSLDALHLASAEASGADYLLTSDDKLEKACSKITLAVKVVNPLKYVTEVIDDE